VKLDTAALRVSPGTKVKLGHIDPSYSAGWDEAGTKEELPGLCQRLANLQDLLYAAGRQSLLVVLQGMDAGGKDGTVRHVFSSVNPQDVVVQSFKTPSLEENADDFLWRIHMAAPAKGRVAVFNRSHYEDVLIVRVHDLVAKDVWAGRYDQINRFEHNLSDSGTKIVKLFLHIDKQEQLRRFKARLDDPARQWKISDSDYSEREYWDAYQEAYEDAISKCSTERAPWYVIPANKKWFRNLAVSQILVETLESMDMRYPEPTVDLHQIRKLYHEAANGS
jgi:PPK2 family polyphosphate:nucleotide phosphotransferase